MRGRSEGGAVADRSSSPNDEMEGDHNTGTAEGVLVEVGDGKGALVLLLDGSFAGREIEISPAGSARRVHTGVLPRHTPAGPVLAAVFGSLREGPYDVWDVADSRLAEVVVASGRVTEWRSPAFARGDTPVASTAHSDTHSNSLSRTGAGDTRGR